jgi:hypothetical protein
MHPTILRRIATREEGYTYLRPEDVAIEFRGWLIEQGWDLDRDHLRPAGKNFASFDRQFLRKLPGWDQIPMNHRTIDPANLFWDPLIDRGLPNTKTCMERAGLDGEVAHTAVEDACVVCRLVRRATRLRRLATTAVLEY